MIRAEKFMEDLAHEALKWMEKEVSELKPHELDYIAALCDLHNGVCEFIEIKELKGLDNPRRRRRGGM